MRDLIDKPTWEPMGGQKWEEEGESLIKIMCPWKRNEGEFGVERLALISEGGHIVVGKRDVGWKRSEGIYWGHLLIL